MNQKNKPKPKTAGNTSETTNESSKRSSIMTDLISDLKKRIDSLLSEIKSLQTEREEQKQKIEAKQKIIEELQKKNKALSQKLSTTQSKADAISRRLDSMDTAAESLFNAMHTQSRDLWIAIQWLLGFAKLYEEGYSFSEKELEYGFDLMIAERIVKFKNAKESSGYFKAMVDLVINSRLGRKQFLEKQITLLKVLKDTIHNIPDKRDDGDWAAACCVYAEAIRTKLTEHGVSILYYKEIASTESELQLSRFFTAGTSIIFDVPILLIDIEDGEKELLSDSGYYRE